MTPRSGGDNVLDIFAITCLCWGVMYLSFIVSIIPDEDNPWLINRLLPDKMRINESVVHTVISLSAGVLLIWLMASFPKGREYGFELLMNEGELTWERSVQWIQVILQKVI